MSIRSCFDRCILTIRAATNTRSGLPPAVLRASLLFMVFLWPHAVLALDVTDTVELMADAPTTLGEPGSGGGSSHPCRDRSQLYWKIGLACFVGTSPGFADLNNDGYTDYRVLLPLNLNTNGEAWDGWTAYRWPTLKWHCLPKPSAFGGGVRISVVGINTNRVSCVDASPQLGDLDGVPGNQDNAYLCSAPATSQTIDYYSLGYTPTSHYIGYPEAPEVDICNQKASCKVQWICMPPSDGDPE